MRKTLTNILAFSFFTLLFGSSMLLSGCIDGSGDIVKSNRNVSGFDKVVLNGSGNVIITQGNKEKVIVETDDNIIEFIETEVNGNTLYIGSTKSISPSKLNIYVYIKEIVGIKVKGSGDINAANSLKASNFTAAIEGSGDIGMDIKADAIQCEIYGSGDMKLSGNAHRLVCTIKGSGDAMLNDLKTDIAEISIYGSGDCKINVNSRLDVSVYGSGDVIFSGNPKELNQNISGSGDILKAK